MHYSKNTPQHISEPSSPGFAPWLWLICSVIYLFSPIDFIPDIPIVGHIDDVLFNLITTLNLLQAYVAQSSQTLATILRMLKIGLIVLSILMIAVIGLLGYAVVKSI